MRSDRQWPRRKFLADAGAMAAAGWLALPSPPTDAATRRRPQPKTPRTPPPRNPPSPESPAPQKPVELKSLSPEQFKTLLDQTFNLAGPNGPISLVLTAVTELKRAGDDARPKEARSEPFSLLFVARNFDRIPAKIYALSNSRIGSFEVYLNEVRADDDPATVHYAVIFN